MSGVLLTMHLLFSTACPPKAFCAYYVETTLSREEMAKIDRGFSPKEQKIVDEEERTFHAWLAQHPYLPKTEVMMKAVAAAYAAGYRDGVELAVKVEKP